MYPSSSGGEGETNLRQLTRHLAHLQNLRTLWQRQLAPGSLTQTVILRGEITDAPASIAMHPIRQMQRQWRVPCSRGVTATKLRPSSHDTQLGGLEVPAAKL